MSMHIAFYPDQMKKFAISFPGRAILRPKNCEITNYLQMVSFHKVTPNIDDF